MIRRPFVWVARKVRGSYWLWAVPAMYMLPQGLLGIEDIFNPPNDRMSTQSRATLVIVFLVVGGLCGWRAVHVWRRSGDGEEWRAAASIRRHRNEPWSRGRVWFLRVGLLLVVVITVAAAVVDLWTVAVVYAAVLAVACFGMPRHGRAQLLGRPPSARSAADD